MDLAELGDRALRRGPLSVAARLRRLRSKLWLIGQCSLAGGVAWFVSHDVLHHPVPFFAPVAALIGLGTTYSQRRRRVVEVAVGVALGVALGDLFHTLFGRGAWQVVVVILIAMSAAVLLDAGALLINQTAVQALVVTTLLTPASADSRVVDAFVGGGVALVAATVVPNAPLRQPNHRAGQVLARLAELLRSARDSAAHDDFETARRTLDRARETEGLLSDLRAAASEGLEVVRSSPFRRAHSPHLHNLAEVVAPLDRAIRNARVLIRRITAAARLHEPIPPDYLGLLDDLADITDAMSAEIVAGRMPEVVRPRLVALGERSAVVTGAVTLSVAVVLAQIRSILVDLLEMTGLDPTSAVEAIPPRSR
jgi:uncharacterized membrane protein YgaE (UPF0421/DUF939 family)